MLRKTTARAFTEMMPDQQSKSPMSAGLFDHFADHNTARWYDALGLNLHACIRPLEILSHHPAATAASVEVVQQAPACVISWAYYIYISAATPTNQSLHCRSPGSRVLPLYHLSAFSCFVPTAVLGLVQSFARPPDVKNPKTAAGPR